MAAIIKGLGPQVKPLTARARTSRPTTKVFCQPPVDQQTVAPAAPQLDASTLQPPVAPYPYPIPAPGLEGQQSSTAVYAAPPGYSPYQVPGREGQQQAQYYMAPPPGYYAPPPPAYAAKESSGSGAPWWIWVGVGVLAANVLGKVQEFMKNPKTPQQMMTEMAMKQMMGAMGSQAGSPFGKPGSMPPFPGAFPPGGFPTPPTPPSATVDVTSSPSSPSATTSTPRSSSPSPDSSARKGEKFASRKASSPSQTGSSSSSTTTTKEPEAGAPSMDVVEPIVKEPPSSRASSSSFFAQAATDSSKGANGSTGSGPTGGAASGNGTAGATPESGTVMTEMMENMLRNPEMQKMLYPYLPEPMRNPQSIEWMLNNPEVKKQMAQMFEQQNMMSPQMMDMMKNMDFNQDRVNQQFQELGLKPEDVISKVMANPELAAGFQNPKVQAAIMDISQNPMNIMKYQSDPEVMKVLNEVTTIFQPDIPPNKRV